MKIMTFLTGQAIKMKISIFYVFLALSLNILCAQPKVQLPINVPQSNICILSGTNVATALTRTDAILGEFTIETPFGISPVIYYGTVEDVPFYHIPLHGSLPASDSAELETNTNTLYRTWSAMYLLGVAEVLGGATAGAINDNYERGDWIIPHDFIDWNIDRPRNIARKIMGEEANYILPRMVPADDPELHRILFEETKKVADTVSVFNEGVIAQAAGGRFETVSEIRMMKMVSCDLVTMSVASEMAYARQLGMNYACMVGIVNPAEGLGEWDWNSLTDLYPIMHRQSIKVYLAAVPRIARELKGKERAGDALRIHPELEEK